MGSRRQQQQQQRFDYLLFANAIPEVNYVNNIENKKLHVLSFFVRVAKRIQSSISDPRLQY